jgi:iron(III) transport system ATP-binding protein
VTRGADTGAIGLAVEGLVKDYPLARGWHRAVADISFRVPVGSFYSLLGPSGCGKTTTIRCVAGLERPDAGTIRLGNTVVASGTLFEPPERRDIGMVFQSYAIWPHMTVFQNAAFPLTVGSSKLSRKERTSRVEEMLALVQLSDYANRPAMLLSGGQQQRLALARALIRQPSLLLLDEPLSNLDARLRDRMRNEIRELQVRLGITTLYVTHDQAEALSMSDRIAVMEDGRIAQEGTPREIYERPATAFVAAFVGTANFIPGSVATDAGGARGVQTDAGFLEANLPAGAALGDAVTISIRPENVRVHADAPATANTLPGMVQRIVFLGDSLEYAIVAGGVTVVTRQHPGVTFSAGQDVHMELPRDAISVLTGGGIHHAEA